MFCLHALAYADFECEEINLWNDSEILRAFPAVDPLFQTFVCRNIVQPHASVRLKEYVCTGTWTSTSVLVGCRSVLAWSHGLRPESINWGTCMYVCVFVRLDNRF